MCQEESPVEEMQMRVRGVLLGLAAGDRIGGPVRMALHLAESLLACQRLDLADIGRRYLAWWRDDAFDTGPTVAAVLTLVAEGKTFEEAARQVDERTNGQTAGCNPAHRCAPLAMCARIPDADLADAAMAEARLTHRHSLAGDAAAAVASLCRALIRGRPWPEALELAAAGRLPPTREALASAGGPLSRSGFAPDALRAAIHFVSISDSFPQALQRAIEFAGPANYSPVLAGSIGGARWGSRAIPETLLAHHGKLTPHIHAAAAALAAGWNVTLAERE